MVSDRGFDALSDTIDFFLIAVFFGVNFYTQQPPHTHLVHHASSILNPVASCIINQNQARIMHQFPLTARILHHASQPHPCLWLWL
jgi:hypothetical protein